MLRNKERLELVDMIVGQYARLAGSIDQMFQVISPRVNYTTGLWRQEGPYKNSGSCRDIDKCTSEIGLVGIAKNRLIALREERNRQVPGSSTVSDCPYHRCESGCVLRELKSPYCLAHMEAPWELRKFGIAGFQLSTFIDRWLDRVLTSESLAEAYANETFVEEEIFYVQGLTEGIKKFPYIGLPARP